MNLRIPGPTPCPEDVLLAGARPMINHRGPEFKEILFRVTDNLKKAFETKNDIIILTTSGTGALESAIVNTLSPGDKVLSVIIGSFGDRFAEMAEAYGAHVTRLTFPLGKAADPAEIQKALRANPDIKAVLVTHNETSTGVTNDLAAISKVVKQEGRLILVDAVSSIGSVPLPVDQWRCDVVATASQKGWMTPPGLAMVSVSEETWEANKKAKMPRVYFDYGKGKKYLQTGETPWTPAVSVFYCLDLALQKMLKEGMDNVHKRHARIGQKVRDGVKALGLEPFADERYASNTVTAVKVPAGVEAKAIIDTLRKEYNVEMAGGQETLKGKIFRIGHLGLVSDKDIDEVLQSLEKALPKLGHKPAKAGVAQR